MKTQLFAELPVMNDELTRIKAYLCGEMTPPDMCAMEQAIRQDASLAQRVQAYQLELEQTLEEVESAVEQGAPPAWIVDLQAQQLSKLVERNYPSPQQLPPGMGAPNGHSRSLWSQWWIMLPSVAAAVAFMVILGMKFSEQAAMQPDSSWYTRSETAAVPAGPVEFAGKVQAALLQPLPLDMARKGANPGFTGPEATQLFPAAFLASEDFPTAREQAPRYQRAMLRAGEYGPLARLALAQVALRDPEIFLENAPFDISDLIGAEPLQEDTAYQSHWHWLVGLWHLQQGNLGAGQDHLTQLLAIRPDYPLAGRAIELLEDLPEQGI